MDEFAKFLEKFGTQEDESYSFYNGEVTLFFDPKKHCYYTIYNGIKNVTEGVTTVLKIINKADALVPWSAKVTIEKLLRTMPILSLPNGERKVSLSYLEFEQIALEAKSAHTEHLDAAGNIGHIAHAWLEQCIKEEIKGNIFAYEIPYPDNEKSASCCKAAVSWMVQHKVKFTSTEQKVYSREYNFAGTGDGVATVSSCDSPLCCPRPFTNRLSLIDWKCLLPEQTLKLWSGATIRADQVLPGDELVSFNEDTKEFVKDRVKSVVPGGEQPCVEVLTKLGRRLKCSANHPVYINGAWIEAKDLSMNDPVEVFIDNRVKTDSITAEEARLLGYFIGDGSTGDIERRGFTNKDPDIISDFSNICDKLGFTFTLSQNRRGTKSFYVGGCGTFLEKHGLLGCKSATKHIPAAIMSGNLDIIKNFLSAYFDCDGHISAPDRIHASNSQKFDTYFTTISSRLAAETQELLLRLGVYATTWQQSKLLYKGQHYDYNVYWVKITDQHRAFDFLEVMSLKNKAKESRRLRWLEIVKNYEKKGPIQDYVTRVKELPVQKTISIEMESTKTFVTAGIVTHNSSNYLYESYLLQTAAYQYAIEEEHTETYIEDRWIIRLGKDDGAVETWHMGREYYLEDWKGFLTCLDLTRTIKSLKLRIKDRKDKLKYAAKEEKTAAKLALKEAAKAEKARIKAEKKAEK